VTVLVPRMCYRNSSAAHKRGAHKWRVSNAFALLHLKIAPATLSPVRNEKEQSRILIVDDRPENLMALKALLTEPNHTVIEANSGKEALKLLLGETIDLILLDVNMPIMDGFETARLVRQRSPASSLPILFVSAREPSAADTQQGYSLGAVDYITKPIVPEVLRAKVSALLDLQHRSKLLEITVEERSAELQTLNERAARLRESISELEAFSYSVSHDLRGPVRAIQGFAQALNEDEAAKISENGKEYLRRIISSSIRLDKMIMDVLAYSRMNMEPMTRTTLDVEKLVRAITEQNPNFQPPDALIEMQIPLLQVIGDETSLTQCVSNVLSNAVKFVAPGVTPRVTIWTEANDGTVRLSIKDNGLGIAPEHQKRIFEAFERLNTDYEGTGFGLAIMRKAVQRMGGRFGVESASGEGSLFWIELPAA
jgi:two-component system, sensor histidine kinase and response regulator